MTEPADIGLVGLAVMGRNLVLNLADHGNRVAIFNRTEAVTDEFTAGEGARPDIVAAQSLGHLVALLAPPRKIVLMVKAGAPVDAVIDQLVPILDDGDIIIDGGNSLFVDTIRRATDLEASGFFFVGAGVSGGEEGARNGPSIMPGGSASAWPSLRPILQGIAARTPDGTPCCDWIGSDGSGHYVKMIHNGIEYGDMQVIAEAYHLLKNGLGMTHLEMAEVFRSWNGGVLDSYLIEITAEILQLFDENGPRVESILDAAGQKGTGKWTVISSMELGQSTTLVAEAVYARIVSSFKDERLRASEMLSGPGGTISAGSITVDDIHDALYASKIVSYAQGFAQMRAAAAEHGWVLDFGRLAQLWRAGCIIRARFLDDITEAFRRDPDLENLLLDGFFSEAVESSQDSWRRVVATAVTSGIPVPAYSTALAYFDSYRSARLPANLIQAQRDYFGAHTYERVDRARGEFFHTHWAEDGTESPV